MRNNKSTCLIQIMLCKETPLNPSRSGYRDTKMNTSLNEDQRLDTRKRDYELLRVLAAEERERERERKRERERLLARSRNAAD